LEQKEREIVLRWGESKFKGNSSGVGRVSKGRKARKKILVVIKIGEKGWLRTQNIICKGANKGNEERDPTEPYSEVQVGNPHHLHFGNGGATLFWQTGAPRSSALNQGKKKHWFTVKLGKKNVFGHFDVSFRTILGEDVQTESFAPSNEQKQSTKRKDQKLFMLN